MYELQSQYFNWLVSIADLPENYILLKKLFNTEFVWSVAFDDNRAIDGINLRYRFGRVSGTPDPVICGVLDTVPCSILEMIVALALRVEEQIMGDESIGDRTSFWIKSMFNSLGLLDYTDSRYDEAAVNNIIYIFLNRQYSRTGIGGLFAIPDLDSSKDMRKADIWAQMCWYMNEVGKGGH